jgi:hypothetical protein
MASTARLAHMVFFELKEDTPEGRGKQLSACQKYLSDHEGTLHFSVGLIAEELRREVNVRNFQVALHIIFKDKASHDRYQQHPRHVQFIEENRPNWKSVRIFDSYLTGEGGERSDR